MSSSRPQVMPVAFVLAVFVVTFAIALRSALALTDAHLVYPLDDTYIHMSIAKHLVRDGVWGVTGKEFSSSSSSPLWTLLVSGGFALFGLAVGVPMVFAFLSACGLVLAGDRVLARDVPNPLARGAIGLLLVFATPIPALAFSGMEHMLHAALTLAFAALAADVLSGTEAPSPARRWTLIALAVALPLTRFESIALVAIVCGLLAIRRHLSLALLAGALSAAPVVAYGLWSRANGWFLLPASVLLKTPLSRKRFGLRRPLGYDLHDVLASPANRHVLLFLMLASLAYWIHAVRTRGLWDRRAIFHALFIAMTAVHLQAAEVGWFYRYEAYLVAFGIVALGIALWDVFGAAERRRAAGRAVRIALVTLGLIVAGFLDQRAVSSFVDVPLASRNIYEQQYQMARLVRERFDHEEIGLNDVGAVSFFSDAHVLDLVGLASLGPAHAILARRYDSAVIDSLATQRRVQIAIVYDHWFDKYGGIPPSWSRIERWRIRDNVILGGTTVSLYGVGESGANRLRAALDAFDRTLPERVERLGPGAGP